MKVGYHKKFLKIFDKLPLKVKRQFYQRLKVFISQPSHPLLNNHPVEAAYPGWRSINITGDYRALYEVLNTEKVVFMKIGRHSELYG